MVDQSVPLHNNESKRLVVGIDTEFDPLFPGGRKDVSEIPTYNLYGRVLDEALCSAMSCASNLPE